MKPHEAQSIRIALIPGDGVGPEVMAQAEPLLSWAKDRGRPLEWVSFPYGAEHFLATGETLSDAHFEALKDQFDAVLFGAIGDPRIPDGRHAEAILLRLRQDLQLSVNHRPCAPMRDQDVPLKGVPASSIRMHVLRENTEGPYCLRGESEDDRAVDLAIHTKVAVQRLLETAFIRAESEDSNLTLAHKANVLKHGHGLWMREFQTLKARYPTVRSQSMHADALLCALIQRPGDFKIIAADNYLGDLISDMLASYMGGMGVAPSLSYAPHRPFRCSALAEPVHGSAPDIAGRGLANPVGMMLSTAELFAYLGWVKEAESIRGAVKETLLAEETTPDLGGKLSTKEMGSAVRRRLES
jgi:3-isopropylmalate dehydrogenase